MTDTTTTTDQRLQLVDIEERPAQPLAVQSPQTPQMVTPTDVLRVAYERGAPFEELAKLLELQDRYLQMQERERARQAELAYASDFAGFRGENIIVPRTKYVDRGKAGSFMQAEYHMVADMLSPALSKHGFSFSHDMVFGVRRWLAPLREDGDPVEHDTGWVTVTCILQHRLGHKTTLTLEGPQGDAHANTPVQNMQVTGSFLKRQSLLAITGTATGGEDDEAQLRARGKRDRDYSDAGQRPPKDSGAARMIEAGEEAATLGTATLVAWWNKLKPFEREAVGHANFGKMKRAAAQFDEDQRRKDQ